jgi:pimeloyl-ACP methyl ester carboxylesterase
VRISTQVIWGEGDKLIPADYAELWRQRLANARISRVPRSGHLPHVERPEVVAQLIKDFAKEATP